MFQLALSSRALTNGVLKFTRRCVASRKNQLGGIGMVASSTINSNSQNTRCNNSHHLYTTKPDYVNYETWHRANYEGPHDNDSDRGIIPPAEFYVAKGNRNGHNNVAASHSSRKTMPLTQVEIPRTSVVMELTDRGGALHDVLKY